MTANDRSLFADGPPAENAQTVIYDGGPGHELLFTIDNPIYEARFSRIKMPSRIAAIPRVDGAVSVFVFLSQRCHAHLVSEPQGKQDQEPGIPENDLERQVQKTSSAAGGQLQIAESN